MISILLFSSGATALASILFLALGSRPPIRLEHIVFGVMMAVCSAYFLAQHDFYLARDVNRKIEIVRLQMAYILLFFSMFATFICLYTDWRPDFRITWAFFSFVAALLAWNFVSPYSLYFTELPQLQNIQDTIGGHVLHLLVAPANAPMVTLFIFQFAIMFGSIYLLLKERPGSWLILAGVSVGSVALATDFVNDAIQGGWPYVGEFGAAIWGICVSLELARDVRRTEQRLENAIRTALVMRDMLNTPLQTLTLGLDLLEGHTPEQQANVDRLKRSVAKISELGQSLKT